METVGDYELHEVVGIGGTATVWRATRRDGGDGSVALKRVHAGAPAAADQLRREVAVLTALDHPHVMSVVAIAEDGDDLAIVMPLAEGGSLRDRLSATAPAPPLTAGEVVAILLPLADALAAAHARGIVHGDVKPENVLFTAAGQPLLADFGVARALDGPIEAVAGTLGYVDPTLLITGRPDPADDVAALATVGLELLEPAPGRPTVRAPDDERLRAVLRTVVTTRRAERPRSVELAAQLRGAVAATDVRLPDPLPCATGRAPAVAPLRRTRAFGPRPPVPPPPGPDRKGLAARGVAALAVAAMGIAVGVAGPWRAAVVAPARVAVVAGPAVATVCPERGRAPLPAGAVVREADLDGRGCPVRLVWGGGVLEVPAHDAAPPSRFDFKPALAADGTALADGDLLVGDWDCDGRDGIALYDRRAGVVHLFDAVPAIGRRPADARLDVGTGRQLTVVRVGRCDRVRARSTEPATDPDSPRHG